MTKGQAKEPPDERSARPPAREAVQSIKRPPPENQCAPYKNTVVQHSGQGRSFRKRGPKQSQMAGPVKRSRQPERASYV